MTVSQIVLALVAVLGVSFALACWQVHAEVKNLDGGPLPEQLAVIRERHQLPALAVVAMIKGKMRAEAAVGVRKLGAAEVVTTADKWHIGSCTKSMTATLAAILVEKKKLTWQTTVADVFPELRAQMKPGWREVTLEQLLTQRGGAPGEAPPDLWARALAHEGTPIEQRLEFVRGLLTRPPAASAGAKFIYSNQGYAIAGAMLERVGGRPWEELMQTMLFAPCGMAGAGFGAPASPGKSDQPWGHSGEGARVEPVEPGPQADNPAAIGPASAVHCSLADLARYCLAHAQGERNGAVFRQPESFAKLHAPVAGQEYAMGWGVCERAWAGGWALTHAGSNTTFFVVIWIAPEKDAVFVAATNIGGKDAERGCDEAVEGMIRRLLPKVQ